MDIDIYQPCPCHAEKKIKFCCGKDVINDLNEVIGLNKGRQSIAALEQIDRAIGKLGPRDCLLTLKTRVQLALNQIDGADETNEAFRKNNPKHAMAHHHRAMIAAARDETDEAVDALQDALDAIKSVQVPISFVNAYRIIGLLLLSRGQVMAARAHLRFAMSLRKDDEQLKQLFLETWQLPGLPLLMRHEFGISNAPEGEPWADGFRQSQMFAGAGRWRKARRMLLKLDEVHSGVPQVHRAIAVLSTWMGAETIEDDWKRYADNTNLGLDESVDAKAYWLLLSDAMLTDKLDVVRFSYSLNDVSAAMENATASEQMVLSPGVNRDPGADESAPLPKAGYAVIDRPASTEASTELDLIPLVMAEAFIFGKQTDRPGRVEVVAVEDVNFEETRGLIESVLDKWIEGEVEREVVGEITQLDHSLRARLKLPDDISAEQYERILAQQTERIYLQICPEIPFTALDGKSLRAAATDESLQTISLAIVSLLEHSADQQVREPFDFNRMRNELGLPEQGPLDVEKVDLENLSPSLDCRIQAKDLSDDDLMGLYVKSMTIGNLLVVRNVAEEILERPGIAGKVNIAGLMYTLAQVSVDNEKAIEYSKRARETAVAEGDNEGKWLVYELDIRLERGMTEGCEEIMRVLQSRYRGDQETEILLIQTLQRHGLVGPQGQMPGMPAGAPPEAPPESGIWTPDQANPGSVQSGAAEQGESKLWIPD